jgi:DNA repair photolyase
MTKIGITERGDPGLDFSWYKKYKEKKYDGLILITKVLSDEFIEKAAEVNCIVHATITGYGGSILEPNVKTLKWSAEQFSKLVNIIGKDRVVLRIDPIIPNDSVTSFLVYHALSKYNTRIRISFLDNYPHIKVRFTKAGLEPLQYNFHAPLELRKEFYKAFNNENIEVCGEPGFDCVGCVSERDLKIFGLEVPKNIKRGFQRMDCSCLSFKYEIFTERKRCSNKCLYCYWK